jgi:heme-degrading monooxygenase HmoA
MIVRTWMAYAKPENARAYRDHLTAHVIPKLQKLQGFQGLELCSAQRGDLVELLVISRWQSMEEFDDVVFHYEVALEAPGV